MNLSQFVHYPAVEGGARATEHPPWIHHCTPLVSWTYACLQLPLFSESFRDTLERYIYIYATAKFTPQWTAGGYQCNVHLCGGQLPRTYSNSASNDTYTAEIIARVCVDSNDNFLKTCMEAETTWPLVTTGINL